MPRPHSCSALPPTIVQRNSVASILPAAAESAMRQLLKINHVELADFQRIDGVKYYVLNVYEKSSRKRSGAASSSSIGMRRLSQFASTAPTAPAIEEKRKPAYRVIKRFRDFEELRKQLQRCFVGTKAGECACCDACTTFLSCKSMQPSLLVKWLKREDERKQLLEQYINQLVRLAVMEAGRQSHSQTPAGAVCHAKNDLPWILEQFMSTSAEQKTKKLADADEHPTRNSIATMTPF